MIAAKDTNMSDPDLNRDVWDITMEEVKRGWLQGPLDESKVRQALGPLFVVSPRFGLRQADKLRPIDDISISLVNSSFSASYTLELDGVDGVDVLARNFAGAVGDDHTVSLELRDGEVLQGKLHSSLSVDDARSLMGPHLKLGRCLQTAAGTSVLVVGRCHQCSRSSRGANVVHIARASIWRVGLSV